jgi:hypothetical protein
MPPYSTCAHCFPKSFVHHCQVKGVMVRAGVWTSMVSCSALVSCDHVTSNVPWSLILPGHCHSGHFSFNMSLNFSQSTCLKLHVFLCGACFVDTSISVSMGKWSAFTTRLSGTATNLVTRFLNLCEMKTLSGRVRFFLRKLLMLVCPLVMPYPCPSPPSSQ